MFLHATQGIVYHTTLCAWPVVWREQRYREILTGIPPGGYACYTRIAIQLQQEHGAVLFCCGSLISTIACTEAASSVWSVQEEASHHGGPLGDSLARPFGIAGQECREVTLFLWTGIGHGGSAPA